MKKAFSFLFIIVLLFTLTNCSVNLYSGRKSDVEKIDTLSNELARLSALREEDLLKMEKIKKALERKLAGEMAKDDIRLEMAERGLVITFIDRILFDSGKAIIKENGLAVLNKVAGVLKENSRDRNIGVEGHTDNVPITYSGWKSNWELSTARATSVLHYLIDKGNIGPSKLSATGYGEHSPIASNNTEEGRRQNRRVEIILLPKFEKLEIEEK